jgi:energy-coupling factor transporter transmembrane protein EcfT
MMTLIMTLSITIYACTTKEDITLCGGGMILILIIAVLCLSIMVFFIKSPLILAIISCLIIIIYGFFGAKNIIFGVKIKDVNINRQPIINGSVFKESALIISGNAKNAVNLSLNGREISINQDGDFNETIALLLGYNVLVLQAQDKFGYTDEKDYQLIYRP